MGKKSNAKKAKREEPEKTVVETPEKSKTPIEVPESQALKMRQILIETDGTSIKISRNETAGRLELLAVLQALIGSLTSPK